jgi:hypothetical protein
MPGFFHKDRSKYTGSPERSSFNEADEARASRRDFIRNAAVGAAGAALAFSNADGVMAASKESGIITLDAILVTYMSATIGANGSSTWRFNNNYANTLRIGSVENPNLSFKAKVPAREEKVFVGHNARQTESAAVDGAITLRHSGFSGWTVGFGTSGGPATPDQTVFFGMRKPRIYLQGNSKKLKFRLIDAESEFTLLVDDLRNNSFGISQETVSSWLRHYITDKAGLTGPRFKFKTSTGIISPDAEVTLNVSEDGDAGFSEARTAVVTARIIDQMGFSSDSLKQTFAVGNHLEITHASVQEFPTDDVVIMETKLERVLAGASEIYWDRVFKNFVIIDAGQ